MPLLEVKNLQVRVEDREILHGLSLTVNEGEVHAIMGPNGSGKSTLSHVIAGKPGYEVTGGEILFRRCRRMRAPPRACSWRFSIRWKSPVSPP
jgi:Fe-S cluster assembly ATP-binding protein